MVAPQACLVSGETGCGKSTQVPQFLLDDPSIGPGCKIVCTQPRRISAIAVAERIAEERGERIGGTVGYTIRLESSVSKDTQLVLMTPGILLKKLGRDPMLKEFTHVLIDEASDGIVSCRGDVHERDRNSEFLLIVLRGLLAKRPDLRLMLMSATLQQGKYSEYFGGCPITTIGARTFPVQASRLSTARLLTQSQQAFFLEDVLVQTDYLKEIGADTGGGGGGKGLLGGSGVEELEAAGADSYNCALCGKGGFRSAEELGTHVAMCFGTAGLDPALKGFSDEGLELLVSGAGGGGGGGEGDGAGTAAASPAGGGEPPFLLSPVSLPLPPSQVGAAAVAVYGGDTGAAAAGRGTSDANGNATVSGARGGGGGGASGGAVTSNGWHGSGDADEGPNVPEGHAEEIDMAQFDADSVGGDPEVEEEDDEEEYLGELAAREDEMDGLQDALASQRWDGRGAFRAERAAAKTGRAEELLTRYQFAFDDEAVDYELVECLLRLGDFLRQSIHFSDERKFQILPLHSGVPTAKQRQVFVRPPKGCRKIVLSTNIAETSITIDDVAFVIDSGRAKESSYDPHLNIKTLVPQWVSKASARQRRGRAGRTKAGVCFHLFSALRHESLREHQESELLRTPLEAKVLGLANGGPGDPDSAAGFLSQAIDAPAELSLRNAVQLLQSLGALDEREELTDLGARLAGISIDPRVGKMVLWSYLLGCAGPALTSACAMTYKDPFVLPMNAAQRRDAKSAKIALAQESESDLIALLTALERHADAKAKGGAEAAASLARKGHLSAPTLGMIWDICGQVARELQGSGLPSAYDWRSPCNSNSRDVSLLSSVLCAGLYPNVAMRRPGATNFKTLGGHTARLHVSSVNAARSQRLGQANSSRQTEFIAFGELTRTAANFVMSNTSPVSPLALLLLCGNLRAKQVYSAREDEEKMHDTQEVATMGAGGPVGGVRGRGMELLFELDDWVQFRLPADQGRNLLVLRNRLHTEFAVYMQANGRPAAGPAADTIAVANALLHEPSVAAGAGNNYWTSRGGGGGRGMGYVHSSGGGGARPRGAGGGYAPRGGRGRSQGGRKRGGTRGGKGRG
ncbi:unnamed protein product [Ectocarpus sp. CCAP 1310/34]|nr:unnamed protein product [Ectocarpus sp. CCAP 1310/34]